jgi:two-component system cell cycle sensor histidine kinase/response regulator CckA
MHRNPPHPSLSTRSEPASPTAKRACVLVAEDEDLVRDLAIEVLGAHGFDAIAARHGGEALSLFSEHSERIDAVLLDLSMPVLDGVVVLGELRKRKPSVRVVVTSGFDDPDNGFTQSGQISFLQKPYRADTLVAQLRALLDAREN